MKGRSLLLGIGFVLLTSTLLAVPGLTNYQGRLTDAAGQPITNPVDVTFTFWDAESGGAQLGGGFSDTDTVTPDADGIYSTLIGDDPTNLVPESIFSGDSVWLNVNIGGEDLAPRLRITSVGYALKSSHADTATTASMAVNALHAVAADTANHAATATTASGLSGALSAPGSRIALGTNVWLQAGADGRLFLSANGQQLALPVGRWTHPAGLSDNISPNGQNIYRPQVAMDNTGNAIIVWGQFDGPNLQIFKSEYRSGTWAHPAGLSDNISPDGQPADDSQVAMDNNGNAIIVWRQLDGAQDQIFKSEYRGGAWTHPAGLSDNISPNGQDVYDPQVDMDNNGNIIIVWQQSNGAQDQIFKSEYRGGVWTHPIGLSDNISPDGQHTSTPRVAMDDDGNAIICWRQSDGSKVQIFKSEYRAGVWTHPGGLSDNLSPDAQHAYEPQVAMDNNGNAIIAWYQSDGVHNQIFKSEYRGGVWTHPGGLSDNISPDAQHAYAPQVAMDNNGNAMIAWHQYDGARNQIFKSEYRAGVWTHPGGLSDNISPDGQDALFPQVAMDSIGNAILVWQQSDGSQNQIFKSEYRGGVWTHPSGLSDNISPDGQHAGIPQVAMDNNGNAVIAWQQSDGSQTQIFKSEYRGGVWAHPGGLSDNISPDGQNAVEPQVTMDNNGNAIIVWNQFDGTSQQLFKSEYRFRF